MERKVTQVRSKESMKQCQQSDKGEKGAERKRGADTDPTTGTYRIRYQDTR